jgi:hypothetical protein
MQERRCEHGWIYGQKKKKTRQGAGKGTKHPASNKNRKGTIKKYKGQGGPKKKTN